MQSSHSHLPLINHGHPNPPSQEDLPAPIKFIAFLANLEDLINPHLWKVPKNTSILTGQAWMDELLCGENARRFYDNMGMQKHVFVALRGEMMDAGILGDTQWVTATEQLGMYLYTLITGLSTKKIQERFQRSPDTVSK